MSTMTTITTMPRERRPTIMKTVDDIPLDRLAYFCMLCLGIGSLLPWNAFITAVETATDTAIGAPITIPATTDSCRMLKMFMPPRRAAPLGALPPLLVRFFER